MISTHCPLHYNGYLQPQQQQSPPQQHIQNVSPGAAATLTQPGMQAQQPHIYAQHPQMRHQHSGAGGGGGEMAQQQTRINQQQQQQAQSHHMAQAPPTGQPQQQHHHHHQQQQQQPHHHHHHNQPHHHHGSHHQPPSGGDQQQQQHRINHMYSGNGGPKMTSNKVLVNGAPGAVVKASVAMTGGGVDAAGVATGNGVYPQKQFRKYVPPTATTTRDGGKPKGTPTVVSQQQSPSVSQMNSSHIPTVSANGIPGAAETTVSRTPTTGGMAIGTILSSSAAGEEKGQSKGSDATTTAGMLGKEKTAMCLVNELSRYNKLTQQYRLTNETGPAHLRRFTVTLTLGKEEYTAEGGSIKKAQHAAASEAIQKTKYKHPPTKVHAVRSESVNLTPTVELNALAMKRREKAVYVFDTPPQMQVPNMPPGAMHMGKGGGGGGGYAAQPGGHHYGGPQFAYRGMNGGGPPHMGHHGPSASMMNPRRFPGAGGGPVPHMKMGDMSHPGGGMGRGGGRPMLKAGMGAGGARMMRGGGGGLGPAMMVGAPTEQVQVTLEVGGRQFIGYGFTAQAARHNAASKALEVLRKLPADGQTEEDGSNGGAGGGSDGGSANGGKLDSKSPVSMIHEIALKRSMTVAFSVKNETGPSHMKVFYTVCTVGEISVEGEGNSKKASKKHAAEKMYQELLKLPPLNVSPQPSSSSAAGAAGAHQKIARPKKKAQETVKKKPKQIIKPEVEPPEELNPISRLMQIQQAKKGKEPVYLLVDQRGTARRREFEMSVEVDGVTMVGTGPNKKLAKRIAAEKLLVALGYEVTPSTASGDNKEGGGQQDGSPAKSKAERTKRGQTVVDGSSSSSGATPVVSANGGGGDGTVQVLATTTEGGKKAKAVKKEKAAVVATEKSTSMAVKEEKDEESKVESGSDGARPKDQLIYLSKIIGFKVQFSDFPKGNHGEYLTLITLNTDPPQLCHGSGKTLEASHDQAALTTLNLLSELGLDNVRPKKVTPATTTEVTTTGGGKTKGKGVAAVAPSATESEE